MSIQNKRLPRQVAISMRFVFARNYNVIYLRYNSIAHYILAHNLLPNRDTFIGNNLKKLAE